jgi:hypothetical protein
VTMTENTDCDIVMQPLAVQAGGAHGTAGACSRSVHERQSMKSASLPLSAPVRKERREESKEGEELLFHSSDLPSLLHKSLRQ